MSRMSKKEIDTLNFTKEVLMKQMDKTFISELDYGILDDWKLLSEKSKKHILLMAKSYVDHGIRDVITANTEHY